MSAQKLTGGYPSAKMFRELSQAAISMMDRAYAPYSHFRVGAALLCSDGTVYGGCNIENAAYTPSNCAERTAFFKAVSDGKREFAAIAIAGGADGVPRDYCSPCGVCRQVMEEFCSPEDFLIIMAREPDDYRVRTLAQLFPEGFGPGNLKMQKK